MTNRRALPGFTAVLLIALIASVVPAAASGGPRNQIKMFLFNTGSEPADQGMLIFVSNKAQSFFTIRVSTMQPNAIYDVLLDGAYEESISTDASGEGRVMHRANAHGHASAPQALPYDPRGHELTISIQGTSVLAASIPTTPEESHALVNIHLDLTPALSVVGSAQADFRSRFGRMKFDVELQGVLPGSYDLIVSGANVGAITADASGNGRIHFDTHPDTDPNDADGIDIPMTFDPRGQTIEIQQSAVMAFSGTFPTLP